jgi:putative membrane protein
VGENKKQTIENDRKKELIVRDWLAIERTKLANERTFLAYFRTSLFIFVSAITIIKIQMLEPLRPMSYFLFVLSPLIFIFGLLRYLKVKKKIEEHYS